MVEWILEVDMSADWYTNNPWYIRLLLWVVHNIANLVWKLRGFKK